MYVASYVPRLHAERIYGGELKKVGSLASRLTCMYIVTCVAFSQVNQQIIIFQVNAQMNRRQHC